MIQRREIIAGLGASTASAFLPLCARGQPSSQVRRIGVLIGLAPDNVGFAPSLAALRDGLTHAGWIEGQNIELLIRWSEGDPERFRIAAKELVAWKPDVILTAIGPALPAVLAETRTIPVVFVLIADPVGRGFVKSLARPGGNATGMTNYEPAFAGKLVEILKEIAPKLHRVTLLGRPETVPAFDQYVEAASSAAKALSLELIVARIHDPADIDTALAPISAETQEGLVALPDTFIAAHHLHILELAARQRFPAVYTFRFYVQQGGLISYGIDPVLPFRSAADYIDRILKGTKPEDLPVQAPTQFELAVNVIAAKALGLTVPQTLLIQADEVIE
jgi:putative ABC transport system substrate-binding protein